MKRKFLSIFNVCLILSLMLGLGAQPVVAHKIDTPAPKPEENEYLLMLPFPHIDRGQVPSAMSAEQVRDFTYRLLYRQAEPVMDSLRHLRYEGKITRFELQPDKNAIAVWSAASLLDLTPQIQGLLPASSTGCGKRAAQALNEKIIGLSYQTPFHSGRVTSIQDTDPSIDVYAPTGATYTYFYGETAANIAVSMRILRSGTQIASDSTTSDDGGDYYFDPYYGSDCEAGGYSWVLQPGDVVEVTANGNTVSTVVSHLEAWGDPTTNQLAGLVDPNRLVDIDFYWDPDPCDSSWYSATATADGYGNFWMDLSSLVDFDARASLYVNARDTNGNGTYGWYDVYQISIDDASPSYVYGSIAPNFSYTASLVRAGSTISTAYGHSSYSGYYDAGFSQDIQPGDQVNILFGTKTISFTVPPLQAILDASTDQVTGVTSAGYLIRGGFEKRDWGYTLTTCSYDYNCTSVYADGSGHFSLSAGMDVLPADYVYVYSYDANGNYIYNEFTATALIANLAWNEVNGYWQTPGADLAVRLLDSAHALKSVFNITASNYAGEFYTWFNEDILPTDIIEVGDGAITATMTVQNLTGALNFSTDFITGSGGVDDTLIFEYYDEDPRTRNMDYQCFETTIPAGAYSIDLTSMGVESADSGELYDRGPDGGYTYLEANALGELVYINEVYDSYVYGHAMQSEALVTGNLWEGVTLVETITDTAHGDGYFYLYFTNSYDTGRRVEVTANGMTVNVTIPTLTINADTVTDSLYGQSPASEPLDLELINYYPCWSGWNGWCSSYFYNTTTADASGNYSASFTGLYDYDYSSDACRYADVGAPCSDTYAYYYQPDENGINLQGSVETVSPDAYEPDNSAAAAKLYTGASVHTFDTTTDEDWIALTIGVSDIGRPYILQTLNLGQRADTYMYLIDTDGSTTIDQDDDSGQGYASLIVWTPSTAGTYYIKIRPYSDNRAVFCGTGYTFVATSYTSVLPITAR